MGDSGAIWGFRQVVEAVSQKLVHVVEELSRHEMVKVEVRADLFKQSR